MFDARLRRYIDPPLNTMARRLAHLGVGANVITLAGMVLGLVAGAAIAEGHYQTGLGLILANRLLDGLDGAVARATHPTDFGGYLDSLADYVFYVAIPVGFGLAAPGNLAYALLLVASFTLTAVSFLAYAAIAAKRGLDIGAHGDKSFIYSTGLAEGGETILAFIVMCLLPDDFAFVAIAFAVVCILTVLQRVLLAKRVFSLDRIEGN